MKHGCGLQRTVDIVSEINDLFSLSLDSIPAPNSVKNWVLKTALTSYNESGGAFAETGCCIITDESMMIGSEKLLLTLGVEPEKKGGKPLALSDVRVLDISVASSWDSRGVSDVLSAVAAKTGQKPAYVISDNASIFGKATREGNHVHIRDVSHSFALILKRIYGNDKAFASFAKAVSDVAFRGNMKLTAYLLPPKQKTTARFMNISPVVEWAAKMHRALDRLAGAELSTYSFLEEHGQVIEELSEVFRMYRGILPMLKSEGLSRETKRKGCQVANEHLESSCANVREAAREVTRFLEEEAEKLPDAKSVFHCSSDIIESLFGVHKNRKSRNKLNGVTTSVLHLPAMTMLSNGHETKPDFKEILENTSIKEIHQWADDNLTENLVVKRRETLKAA